ncbi:hypothetical protein RhiirA5_409865 [Rhizophagus irregularis]|uniref:Uncharacterized protein n=3 Tax=Rhizophagus irregularis TaxID=588596 RepID=A0A2N0Q4N4_9GLOM|nr:hypothetical protein RirG_054320 [Rhizophagus irregularis DAOM 197198w]PKC14051.1 hypothetical protein RhiirA5_409865 [Rhizophagus irregularis]UZO00746.1 hypothetical protein OCT59_011865 [Rhizophagus irregularis]GBC39537.1 hypothetical protein GLOIN_2v1798535 [Rhizophagus irregularis DAOM 181602=DAOM 197198]
MSNPQIILADNCKKILTILNNIAKNEDNTPLIGYPVLIGSRATKWHNSSFREPNDWDLVATPSQTTLFINKVEESIATFRKIKLIHYPGGGLKLVGEYIDQSTDEKSISFDIELVSEKVDLRNMKLIMSLNKEESDDEDESDKDDDQYYRRYRRYFKRYNFDDDSENSENNNDDDSENSENNKDDDNKGNTQDDDEINKIEFEMFDDPKPKISALMILELCRNIEDKTILPLLSNYLCIVAPLKILEALKTSHIYWPEDFYKNISDLHWLRILLDYNKVSPIQPLCSPQRDELIELMLKTRIKETEIIRGNPGAHINLNMSNEDFLENEDNLFVQTRVPHDDLHELVKYGDHPIYQGLKDDQSKAWIKKSLFEKLDYQTKINCVKEEAMAIALERYLIPMISNNQENSYKSALVRICTTLTKGWYRKFAIDNYPRLSNLDKDLLSIANNIIEKFPIKQKKPDIILLDPETQAIFESIRPYTKTISSFDEFEIDNRGSEVEIERTGIKITSPVNDDISVTAIITTVCISITEEVCTPSADWTASVVILPTNDMEILSVDENNKKRNLSNFSFIDPLNIHPYYESYCSKFLNLTSKNTFVLAIDASSGSSWGVGQDVWKSRCVEAKSADYVASLLEIPDLTGDLLFKYVLDYLKPTLKHNGETPLKNWINTLKVKGDIPMVPNQHLWYNAWNYKLNKKSKKSHH